MNAIMTPRLSARPRAASWSLLFTAVVTVTGLLPATARAQIFVTSYPAGTGTIGEYNMNGTPANATLVQTGTPYALAVSGSDLLVTDPNAGKVSDYTIGSGGAVTASNTSLISGLIQPYAIAVSGSNLFVPTKDSVYNSLLEYPTSGGTAITFYSSATGAGLGSYAGNGNTPGLAVSGSNLVIIGNSNTGPSGFIREFAISGGALTASNLTLPGFTSEGIAVLGSYLFVTNESANTIGEYSAIDGSTINASFISSGLNGPWALAASGSNLFVTNSGGGGAGAGFVNEYTISGGALSASTLGLISGLTAPEGIAVMTAIPEPSTWPLLAGCAVALLAMLRRRRDQTA